MNFLLLHFNLHHFRDDIKTFFSRYFRKLEYEEKLAEIIIQYSVPFPPGNFWRLPLTRQIYLPPFLTFLALVKVFVSELLQFDSRCLVKL